LSDGGGRVPGDMAPPPDGERPKPPAARAAYGDEVRDGDSDALEAARESEAAPGERGGGGRLRCGGADAGRASRYLAATAASMAGLWWG